MKFSKICILSGLTISAAAIVSCSVMAPIVGPSGKSNKSDDVGGNVSPTPSGTSGNSSSNSSQGGTPASWDSKATFGQTNLSCSQSGYGTSIAEDLTKMDVCCVALSQQGLADGTVKFVSKQDGHILVKPEKCDAVVLSGKVSDLALPIDFDLSGQKYASIQDSSMLDNAHGAVTIKGGDGAGVTLLGGAPLVLRGQAAISNIHAAGVPVMYALRDVSVNDLSMTNVQIDGHNGRPGTLTLSTSVSASATTGMKMAFKDVKVASDSENAVLLSGYPFDITGIEITPGKFAPHVVFADKYIDTKGVIAEKRFPVVLGIDENGRRPVELADGSKLQVGPGVQLKIRGSSGFKLGYGGFNLTLAGSSAEPVVVTSSQDDSVGGDTNGDADTTKGHLLGLVDDNHRCYDSLAKNQLNIHDAKLIGTYVSVEGLCQITVGNSSIVPAQDGSTPKYFFTLYSYDGTYPMIRFDAPVVATQRTHTYTGQNGNTASAFLYAETYSRFSAGERGTVVSGLENVTVNTPDGAPTDGAFIGKVVSDNGKASPAAGICDHVSTATGQPATDDILKSTFFWTGASPNALAACK